jgi:hypothetical protein
MKNFWERYWKWSDKINAPFREHKERLILYVVLAQTVLVTIGLLNLFKTNNQQLIMLCRPINFSDVICVQSEVMEE